MPVSVYVIEIVVFNVGMALKECVMASVRKVTAKQSAYIAAALDELQKHPEKIDIVRNNIEVFRTQRFLKRGFLNALERMVWIFDAHDDVGLICQSVMSDNYIGNAIRKYPLIFKGVVEQDR